MGGWERERPGRSMVARPPPLRNATALAASYMRTGGWDAAGVISPAAVDAAERWVLAQSKWTVTGGWRAKWYNGSLWVKMLRMEPHWAERTQVLRLLLAAVKQRPPLPPFDVLHVHNDRDPTPKLRQWRQGGKLMAPLLTNGHEARRASLPVPDYSFAGWHTHTPPWCALGQSMQEASERAVPWDNRTDRAFFSGARRAAARLAA